MSEIGIGVSVGSVNREYFGEKRIDGEYVIITQEVDGEPKVAYDGENIIITFLDREYRYSVGKLDASSISANVRNNVLTVRGKRWEDAGENNESVEEEKRT